MSLSARTKRPLQDPTVPTAGFTQNTSLSPVQRTQGSRGEGRAAQDTAGHGSTPARTPPPARRRGRRLPRGAEDVPAHMAARSPARMQQSPSSAAGVAAPLLQMAQGDQALVLVRPLAPRRPPPVLCLRLGWPGDSAVEESPLPCKGAARV